jgi:hypothetical protein
MGCVALHQSTGASSRPFAAKQIVEFGNYLIGSWLMADTFNVNRSARPAQGFFRRLKAVTEPCLTIRDRTPHKAPGGRPSDRGQGIHHPHLSSIIAEPLNRTSRHNRLRIYCAGSRYLDRRTKEQRAPCVHHACTIVHHLVGHRAGAACTTYYKVVHATAVPGRAPPRAPSRSHHPFGMIR